MQNRDGMRPPQIDDKKPFKIIKDIENTKKHYLQKKKKN